MQVGDRVFYEFKPVTIIEMTDGKVTQVQSEYGSHSCGAGLTVIPLTTENETISKQFNDMYMEICADCRNFWKGDILSWLEERWLEAIKGEKPNRILWREIYEFADELKTLHETKVRGCRLNLS